jgi:SAM-dependent methyltransferase
VSDRKLDMTTDAAWEEWGKRDPYFGVITDPRFRRSALNEATRRDFFATGVGHVDYLMNSIRLNIDPGFAPRTILDFGCGVGRLLIPFAALAQEVVGLDVAQSMLAEARRNCDERQVRNVTLLMSDDQLSALSGKFDLVHSCIVLQHVPFDRGKEIFAALIRHLNPGGIGAIQLVYANAQRAEAAPVSSAPPLPPEAAQPVSTREVDPEIQMNAYEINPILLAMQSAGVREFHTSFTDHGGELGVFLLFQLPRG